VKHPLLAFAKGEKATSPQAVSNGNSFDNI
jgi:hypothetical protein